MLNHSLRLLAFILAWGAVPAANAHEILFVGNSFIGFSLPAIEQFAQASPFETDQITAEFVGGSDLQFHTMRAETLLALQCKRFDYVILQDQSQRPILDVDSFRFGIETLVGLAKKNGAQPLLFQTWARGEDGSLVNYDFNQDTVSTAYLSAGRDLGIPVIQVGDVWRQIKQVRPSLFGQLFQGDIIHPSRAGQYAVAASVYNVLYDTDLSWAPSYGLPASSIALINSAARLVNKTTVDFHNERTPVCKTRNAKLRARCDCGPLPPIGYIAPINALLLE